MGIELNKAFKLPLSRRNIGSRIWDANDNIIAQFLIFDTNLRNSIIAKINNNLSTLMYSGVHTIEYDQIICNDVHLIEIRGWDYLTGVGGLNLSDEEAIDIQLNISNFIIEKLNS